MGIVNPDDVTLAIEDDGDRLLPAMSIRDAQLTEGDSGETDMNFRVELSPATTLPVTFRVRTSEIDGLAESATSGRDYTAVDKNVTIAPGETVATVSVPIVGDTVHELENEYFLLFGSTVGEDPPAYFRDYSGAGWIIDNDRPTMTLALSEDRIREDGGVTTVTASLDRPSVKKTFVRISASAVSPAVKGDFTFGGNRGLTIAAGELSSTRTVTLTAVDNAVDVLFDKTVRVTGNARNELGIDHPEALTLTIVDDEIPVVTIAAETEEVIEEQGAVTFIATRTEYDLSRSLAVNFLSDGGESLPSGTITFAANETTARLGGSPWGDIDADGTVTITLQDGDGYELGTPSSASVTVRDITPVVTIAAETAEVVEEQGAVAFIVTRTELNVAESLTVNFLSNGGESLPSGTVTFAPNETAKRLGGSPWGDIDFDSTVSITLQDGDGYRLGTPSSASVAVRDEDVPVVTVAAETAYVYEEGEPVAFIFTRTEDEDLPRSLTVNYRVRHIGGYVQLEHAHLRGQRVQRADRRGAGGQRQRRRHGRDNAAGRQRLSAGRAVFGGGDGVGFPSDRLGRRCGCGDGGRDRHVHAEPLGQPGAAAGGGLRSHRRRGFRGRDGRGRGDLPGERRRGAGVGGHDG